MSEYPQSVKQPEYSKQAAKYIMGLDRLSKKRIKDAILKIPQGNIKPLQGVPGTFRLRISDWRILFSYPDAESVLIEKISQRGEAYKKVE